jgi:hypothetical protein
MKKTTDGTTKTSVFFERLVGFRQLFDFDDDCGHGFIASNSKTSRQVDLADALGVYHASFERSRDLKVAGVARFRTLRVSLDFEGGVGRFLGVQI